MFLRRSKRWGLFAGFFLLLVQGEAATSREKLSLQWSELERAVAGKMVAFVLPDGTAIKGTVVRLASNHLVIDIRETSDRSVYPRGEASIARSSVTTLQTKEIHGRWRTVGTAVGAAAGGTVGALVYRRFNNEANPQTGIGAASGIIGAAAAAGYFAGRSADTHITTITIIPE